MSDQSETFFTSIGCMDGRVQEPIIDFGQNKFGVKFGDTITEAGLVGQFSKESIDQNMLESIKKKVGISLEKHHSKGIVVHGHGECAGNPVDDEKHKEDVVKTAEIIRSFVPSDIPIIPVFVENVGGQWTVKELPVSG